MCDIDEEHEPHTYEGTLCPVWCEGAAASRHHSMSVIGKVKCTCGWGWGDSVASWDYAIERLIRHFDDHPEGAFGRGADHLLAFLAARG